MTKPKNAVLPCAFLVFLGFFAISLTRTQHAGSDESESHYPNMMNFYENGLHATFNSRYSAANTPLPYIIVAAISKITSPTLLTARIVTGVLSFLAFVIVMTLLESHGAPRYRAFIFLFYPYFFVNSFVFYVINFGLLFGVMTFYVLDTTDQRRSVLFSLLTGICISLAVLCQQFYLMIPFAIVLVKVARFVQAPRSDPGGPIRGMFLPLFCLLIPLIIPLLLFGAWGGLTHSNFRDHTLGFHLSTIVGILLAIGFFFFPYLLHWEKPIGLFKLAIVACASLLLVAFARPTFSNDEQPGAFTGFTNHLISIIDHRHPILSSILMFSLVCGGLLIFLRLAIEICSEWEWIAFTSSVLLAAAYTFNDRIGERHLLALITLLFLLVLPRIKKAQDLYYSGLMAALGTGYFVYWIFFKFA